MSQPHARPVRTPCIGICSTTSLGDRICRGCKRYAFEVIAWNGYSEAEKAAVMSRIEKLTTQIMAARFHLFSVQRLEQVLIDFRVFYDPALSPWCWLHNLLQKHFHRIGNLAELGVELQPEHAGKDIRDLLLEINQELLTLSEAHLDRYFGVGPR